MMKRNLSPHSFIKVTLNRWKQKQRERTLEEQNQPGTQIQIHIYNLRLLTRLEHLLNQRLIIVMIGRRPENLSQTSSSCWWLKKRFPLSSRSGAPVWTRRTQSLHTLKRNRRNSGSARRESSFKGWRRMISPSSHPLLSL
ncbi:uncharacterized protein LOC126387294 isoform X1 [Epinephelus moara]|uniref:uncharacterized protein LOC126387294 isoform X1 n=1 Tax=Epinephelus moara TaxID=300413 RepID=UPI00214E3C7B|nr:uncharacterized protein LOC126387294 isoform X1 [Epinephelus moara]